MKTSLLFFSLMIVSTAYAKNRKCVLDVNSQNAGYSQQVAIATIDHPTRKMTLGANEYFAGIYCDPKTGLDARIEFKDPSGDPWVITVGTEGRPASSASIIALRSGKKVGPQIDVGMTGPACDFLKKDHPFSLIGLETKDGVWFSAALDCPAN